MKLCGSGEWLLENHGTKTRRSWSQRVAQARDTFLADCEADARCRATTPDLLSAYRQVVAWLEHDAPSIALPPALHVPNDQVRLTASLFEEVVGRMIAARRSR